VLDWISGHLYFLAAKAPRDIVILTESLLLLYILVSFVLISVIYYFVFVGRAIPKIKRPINRHKKWITYGLLIVYLFNVSIVYAVAAAGYLFLSFAVLLIAMIVFTVYYFRAFRPLLRSGDFRVQSTVAIWTVVDVVMLSAMLFLFIFRDTIRLEGQLEISYDIIVQAASVFISALGIVFTYVMRTEQTQRNAQQQLYQTLELQSVELFRFECDHPHLVKALWFDPPAADAVERDKVLAYSTRQYVCQMLNLFEMAIRFRTQGILLPEVFGSWVIWIWEVCECRNFQDMWLDDDDLPSNYIPDLREILSAGVEIASANPEGGEESKRKFFREVADHLDCHEVKDWLKAPRRPR
jgi:hypothetical protein